MLKKRNGYIQAMYESTEVGQKLARGGAQDDATESQVRGGAFANYQISKAEKVSVQFGMANR